MLKIRLQRTGRKNDPSFRIVVLEHTESTKSGSIVEQLGTYNPKTKEKNLIAERIKHWLSVGAKATGTMHNMLISAGIIEGKKVNVLPKKSPPKPAPTELPAGASAQAGASGKDSGQKESSTVSADVKKEEVPAPELNDDPKAAAATVAAESK